MKTQMNTDKGTDSVSDEICRCDKRLKIAVWVRHAFMTWRISAAAAILRVALEIGRLLRFFSGKIRVRGSLGSSGDVRKKWEQGDIAEGYAVAGCRQFF